MFVNWPIKKKLAVAGTMLAMILAFLSYSGIRGAYAYRGLVKGISNRAAELPLTAEMSQYAVQMETTVWQVRELKDTTSTATFPGNNDMLQNVHVEQVRQVLAMGLHMIRKNLDSYGRGLLQNRADTTMTHGLRQQRDELLKLSDIKTTIKDLEWYADPGTIADEHDLKEIHELLGQLVIELKDLSLSLQTRMESLAVNVRSTYRAWIVLSWFALVGAAILVSGLGLFIYRSLLKPFRTLLQGSRLVARGKFDHRIEINSQDEMAELASAMNDMTQRFQEIRDDLDQQVKLKTREIVRSEQLASVGFLAAGVSHEINNPLQSIALCAESLEERLHDVIQADDKLPDDQHNSEITVVRQYLRMIQDEAFRCKQITGQLLDFARLGESERTPTDLNALTHEVVQMISHLGRYKNKEITFTNAQPVIADVNAQEIKQVALNLLTNGLDSIDQGGSVVIDVREENGKALLRVKDTGCGMTDEVKQHLFEPFYTRRRDGKGTGLGLSISYAIIQEHGGDIVASSDGPGTGSEFVVTVPLVAERNNKESSHQYQAA